MRAVLNLFMTLTILAALATPSSADIIASSTFNTGSDGWLLAGDSTSAAPTYFASGGNPGGFLRGFDQTVGGTFYWDAPGKFLGDISAAYGQALTYDLRQRGQGTIFSAPDVILRGDAIRLVFDTRVIPRDIVWTSYSILLTETSGWRVGTLDGAAPTRAQFLSVLAGTNRLAIRGEFIDGRDNGDLDNVVLNAVPVPEPTSLALALVGVVGMVAIARRRRNA